MATERIQRRIDLLLDEADQAVANSEWVLVLDRAKNVLAFDPENQDALAFLTAAKRALGGAATSEKESSPRPDTPTSDQPISFAISRWRGNAGNLGWGLFGCFIPATTC